MNMTGRERVIAAIERTPLDRIPRYDGFWEDALQRWETEGMRLPQPQKILVDGEEVETIKALGSVISFYIDGEAGETHNVEMIYRPNTLSIGISASLISAAIPILLIVFERKMKKIPFLRAVISIPAQPATASLPEKCTTEEENSSDGAEDKS
jgi:hypothetical protein